MIYAPYHLRFLYAQLIIDKAAPALELWEKYKNERSADHSDRFSNPDLAYLEALRDIERLSTPRGSHLSNLALPDPGHRIYEFDIESETFGPRMDELTRTANDTISKMVPLQLESFNVLYTGILSSSPVQTVFHVDGKAGRGKSFVAAAPCAEL